MENVSPIVRADRAQIITHLEFLFGRALTGRIEITAIHVDKDGGPRPKTRFFEVGEFEDAADYAEEVNNQQGWNTYVGAALRKDDVFPGKAADDTDFLKTYALWADADDGAQLAAARGVYRSLGVTPPFIVVTGRTPSKRAQLWWPLDNPIEDIAALRAALRGIVGVLNTDPKVCTGKQLMRLGGTVNWPKKEDRVLERTEIVRVDRADREFSLERLARAFPPVERLDHGADGIPDIEIAHGGALGLEERIMDGRESYAFRLVRANLREWIGTTGSAPTPDELYRAVAPTFFKKTDQVRAGRGPAFLKQKCVEAVRAFDAGQIPGMRDLDEAVLTWAENHGAPSEADHQDEPADDEEGSSPSAPFRASELTGDPPERQWIVKDWIVQGAVNSLYGDGGLGKTLLAQQLACSVSLGVPWLGMPTTQGSVLAVLCEDDKGELHRRHNAIKAALGYPVGNPFSDVWLWPRVGDENVLVRWDRDGKATHGPFVEDLTRQLEQTQASLLILDTLADFYGGNEIDRVQVNYFVKTILGGFIKARADAGSPLTVILLGHPSVGGKADGRGFSGSTAWNNSVRSRIYLTRPEEGASDERILTRGKANYAASGDETAIRLFYADGVLHAQQDEDDTNSLLWAARQEAIRKVADAWRRGDPYSARKDHKRFLFALLPLEMTRDGFAPALVRQALRECVDDGKISVRNANGKRGYRAADND